jgi:toxin ParE1/3/4
MSRVFRTVLTNDDLKEIGAFIGRGNPDRAETFIDEIISMFDAIAGQPLMGRSRADIAVGLRSHPFGRYIYLLPHR